MELAGSLRALGSATPPAVMVARAVQEVREVREVRAAAGMPEAQARIRRAVRAGRNQPEPWVCPSCHA